MMNSKDYMYFFHINNYSLDGGCFWWDLFDGFDDEFDEDSGEWIQGYCPV